MSGVVKMACVVLEELDGPIPAMVVMGLLEDLQHMNVLTQICLVR